MREFLDEWDYLIHLIRCAIHDQQPRELPEGFDFERIYEYGAYHHVANIAFYSLEKLKNKPETALYAKWEICRDQAIIRDINQSYAAEEIREALQNAHIRTLEVQGTKIKPLYPQPDYRTMSDIDFLVDLENLPRARTVLESLGYECRDEEEGEVDGFRSPNINIELHTAYFPKTVPFHQVMRPPFASVEETGQYDINEFYLYNLLHIIKHYYDGGCGIRRVLDIYFLNQHFGKELDWDYVNSILETAKVTDLAAQLAALGEGWFGQGNWDGERSELVTYIINSGLHGTAPNARNNHLKRNFDNRVRFPKLRYFLKRIIGTREILYLNYPILKRWKILYPLCWCHRIICALGPSKRKRLSREAKAVMQSKQRS